MASQTEFERRYLQLADGLPDGLLLVNSVGAIILANKASSDLLGYGEPASLVGLNVSSLYVNPVDHDSLLSIVGYKGSADRTIFDWKKKNGDPILAEITAVPVRDDQGHVDGIHIMFRDITSKLKSQMAQQEVLAETADTFKEERLLESIEFYRTIPLALFLQGIAHNLNTPLGSIRGRSELLQHGLKKSNEWIEQIADPKTRSDVQSMVSKFMKGTVDIIGQVDRLGELIRSFADKLSADMNLQPADVDLNFVVGQEVRFFESSLYFKHKVTFRTRLEPSLPKVRGVYRDFSMALENLMINSVRATAHESERLMEISTKMSEEFIEIEVADNRPHLGEEDIGYLMTLHLDTMYQDLPADAQFGRCDVEIPAARWYLDRYEGDVRIVSDDLTRLTLLIPRQLAV